ncbi:MAG: AMP-binding protein [Flavobacteriaceae bacterium]
MRPAFSLGEDAAPPPYPSLAEAILGGVGRFADGGFLHIGADGQARRASFAETFARARGLAAGLREEGVRPGDALLVALTDAADIVAAIWAGVFTGAVTIPSQRAPAPGAAPLDGGLRSLLEENFDGFRVLADKAAGNADPAVLDFGALAAAGAKPDEEPFRGSGEDLRFAILSSGTTGRPRLVGLSDRAALARWWPQLPDAAAARGFLSWTSFGHVMGLGLAMPNLPLKAHLDASRFIAAPLSWLDALETAELTHATMTNFGMSLVSQAVAANPDRRWRLDHVRKIGIGAEAISGKACARFLKTLAKFGLREDALILGYGLSECGPVAGGGTAFRVGAADDVDAPPELDRPTSGHGVRIVGETGYLLREGETGRIEVRGPTMTDGYIGDAGATAALFTPDGWLRTGDLGVLRDGRLTVVGREKELIVVNARKYTCQEIETAIAGRTGFTEVLAAPLGGGEEALAGAPCAVFVVVESPGEPAAGEVADAVRAATGAAFRFAPRAVALVSPGDIPRTGLGKIRRLELPGLLDEAERAGRASYLAKGAPAAGPQSGNQDIEGRIAGIWRELLRSDGEIDRDADFFTLGGDSLLALRMSFLLEDAFGVPVRIEQLPAKLSVSELARFLSGSPAMRAEHASPGRGLPDWFVTRLHGFLENWPGKPALPDGFVRRVGTAEEGMPVFWCMQDSNDAIHFGRTLGAHHPAYAMRSGLWLLDYDTPIADALTDRYYEEIKRICPQGPLVVAGTCQGVYIALEITRRLVAEGRDVRLFAAADCRFAEMCEAKPVPVPVALFQPVGSKFNPYRYFRYPEAGLRKLTPYGLRLQMVDAIYAKIMQHSAMDEVADGLEAAIGWAETQAPECDPPIVPNSWLMYQRRLTSPSKSLDLRAGERASVAVKVKNISSAPWEPFERSGLALGNHWLSGDGAIVVWSDGRTPLTRALRQGERAFMTLDVVAPSEPGDYLLEVDMVEEGVRWIAEIALAPLLIPVTVRAREGEGRGASSRRPALLPAVYRLADRLPFLRRLRGRK